MFELAPSMPGRHDDCALLRHPGNGSVVLRDDGRAHGLAFHARRVLHGRLDWQRWGLGALLGAEAMILAVVAWLLVSALVITLFVLYGWTAWGLGGGVMIAQTVYVAIIDSL